MSSAFLTCLNVIVVFAHIIYYFIYDLILMRYMYIFIQRAKVNFRRLLKYIDFLLLYVANISLYLESK